MALNLEVLEYFNDQRFNESTNHNCATVITGVAIRDVDLVDDFLNVIEVRSNN